jgi:hypothetical protein
MYTVTLWKTDGVVEGVELSKNGELEILVGERTKDSTNMIFKKKKIAEKLVDSWIKTLMEIP